MIRRLKIIATFIAAFIAPAAAYLLLWAWIGQDVMNRVGYWLWLITGPDDVALTLRIYTCRFFFRFVAPIILGIAGLGWLRICRKSAARRNVTE